MILSPRSLRIFAGAIVAAIMAIAICGWFYYRNFSFLKFYYVDWNQDANAHLKFTDSLRHYVNVMQHLGWMTPAFCLLFGMATFFAVGPKLALRRLARPTRLLRDGHWAALYIGLAPVTMLVLRGAGLNPYVSMPACFGLLMFLLTPDTRIASDQRPAWLSVALAAISIAVLVP